LRASGSADHPPREETLPLSVVREKSPGLDIIFYECILLRINSVSIRRSR
jgi:hypothetical protein